MSVDSLELIDLSTVEQLTPKCDYFEDRCQNAAVWIVHMKQGAQQVCCNEPVSPLHLLCERCWHIILTSPWFRCPKCDTRISGNDCRKNIDRVERL